MLLSTLIFAFIENAITVLEYLSLYWNPYDTVSKMWINRIGLSIVFFFIDTLSGLLEAGILST